MKIRNNKIVIAGSLAYDYIMDFPGHFEDHILAHKIHQLNVSFSINRLKASFGGTAGNIAYSLSLLNEKSIVLGVMGKDAGNYLDRFKKYKINTDFIKVDKTDSTAGAYIITDKKNNQITGFFPGPQSGGYPKTINKVKESDLFIISAEAKDRMLFYSNYLIKNKKSFIFDPGQQIINFTKSDFKKIIPNSDIVIGNDYEIEIIKQRLGINLTELKRITKTLIITKSVKGSVIYSDNQIFKIPVVKPSKVVDPTGAGDAYRAGLIKGLILGLNWENAGRLAALVAVYAVETAGTQEHKFNWTEIKKRYKVEFKRNLI